MQERFDDHEIILDQSTSMPRNFVANVFSWMTLGLVVTGIVAYLFSHSSLASLLYDPAGGSTMLRWIIVLAPFGFILAINYGLQKWSASTLTLLFLAFSTVMGMSLSSIFLIYSSASISTVFFITAGTFGAMAVLGYTTSTDLTKFGGILRMALIGIIIAMVVNWFMGSAQLDYIISILGVLIFTGLTAYDTQMMKRIGAGVEYGSQEARKLAILGATSLYLDFINLFLFLLRILGSRD
ncbi:MAG: Bax inhibitor-1/YccA family protein [Flavobacteriales bacterium]|nr:Bax inhibitor-1/YccA family protein [Flavobacteriales bacterium]